MTLSQLLAQKLGGKKNRESIVSPDMEVERFKLLNILSFAIEYWQSTDVLYEFIGVQVELLVLVVKSEISG